MDLKLRQLNMNKQASLFSRMLTSHSGTGFTKPVFAVVTLGITLGLGHLAFAENTALTANNACQCSDSISYNNMLPSSHPNNRCATENTDVSWKNWLTGKSRSSQFHFLDLLELLHGHKSQPNNDSAPL
jgi:hypothetical protein